MSGSFHPWQCHLINYRELFSHLAKYWHDLFALNESSRTRVIKTLPRCCMCRMKDVQLKSKQKAQLTPLFPRGHALLWHAQKQMLPAVGTVTFSMCNKHLIKGASEILTPLKSRPKLLLTSVVLVSPTVWTATGQKFKKYCLSCYCCQQKTGSDFENR